MIRRTQRTKASIFSPAGELLRKLSAAELHERWQQVAIGAAVAIAIFLYASFTGESSVQNIIRLGLEQRSLTAANQHRFADLVDANYEIDRLRHDRLYLEHIARSNYRMVFPNEILYRHKGE
jgi:cell division protein FtsB